MNAHERQKQVLILFNGDKDLVLSKPEIIEGANMYYYHNTQKHAGDVLSRMVNNGLLKRPKKGYYRLGAGKQRTITVNPNQTEMFKA